MMAGKLTNKRTDKQTNVQAYNQGKCIYIHAYTQTNIQPYEHTHIMAYMITKKQTDKPKRTHIYELTLVHTYTQTNLQSYGKPYKHTNIRTQKLTRKQTDTPDNKQTDKHAHIHSCEPTNYKHKDIHAYQHTHVGAY